jgi:ATP-dependent RNA helicase DDX46/PRP5
VCERGKGREGEEGWRERGDTYMGIRTGKQRNRWKEGEESLKRMNDRKRNREKEKERERVGNKEKREKETEREKREGEKEREIDRGTER